MGRKKVTEGKTKIIWEDPQYPKDLVLIESKDDITAGDGAKRDMLPNKSVYATETTCNVFKLLEDVAATHFHHIVDSRTFCAQRLTMAPLEVVIRQVATGSFLKRYPDTPEGAVFNFPVTEFFLKDDAHHDPLLIFDAVGERWLLFDAKRPLADGYVAELKTIPGQPFTKASMATDILRIREVALNIFFALSRAWGAQYVTLVDLKLEFGTGSLYPNRWFLGDVIDNDSWRIWPHGDRTQMRDKQTYRNLPDKATEADLRKIEENYKWVAETTRRFIQ